MTEPGFNQAGEFKEPEPNNDATTATPMTFAPNTSQAGHYYLSTLLGTFSDASDVHVYSFTVPADLALDSNTRAVVNFNPQPPGTDGNGSTTNMGEVDITTKADPNTVLAKIAPGRGQRSDAWTAALLRRRAHIRSDDEAHPLRCFQREACAAAGHDVQGEPGVLPQLVLVAADVEGRAVDLAEQDVTRSDAELALRVAHRSAAVAAAARLMEHERTVVFPQFPDQPDGGFSRHDLWLVGHLV